MSKKFRFNFLLYCILTASIFIVSLPSTGYAQTAATSAQAQTVSDLPQRLKTLEEKVEAARTKFGVPGMVLAVVKDGEVVFIKAFGYKDFDKKIAVTGDTEFEIGSATKAFTALSVLMSQEEGKLNINDNPKKYLPYFKINDPETDKNIAIRDLLSHSSGLNRTDLAMVSGKLNREELIRVGDEDVFVVTFEPEKGNKAVLYFSRKTFLPLKLESASTITSLGVDLPYTQIYGDYRAVDGIMLPFKTVNTNISNGEIVTVLKEVKHNVPVDDKVFKFREK